MIYIGLLLIIICIVACDYKYRLVVILICSGFRYIYVYIKSGCKTFGFQVNKQQYPHLNHYVPSLVVVGAHRCGAFVNSWHRSVSRARRRAWLLRYCVRCVHNSCVRCASSRATTMCRNSAVCSQWTAVPLCLFCEIITCFCQVLHVVVLFSDNFSTVCM